MRGLKPHSTVTKLVDSMRCRSTFSLSVQETWRSRINEFTKDAYTVIEVGPDSQNGRGSFGAGILLSPVVAWKEAGAGNLHTNFGPRIISARMLVADPAK